MAEVSGHSSGTNVGSNRNQERHNNVAKRIACLNPGNADGNPRRMKPSLFCFGLGYTATGLGHVLMEKGWKVSGTCSSPERARTLQKEGFCTFVFHAEKGRPGQECFEALRQCSHVLISIPPKGEGGTDCVLEWFEDFLIRSMEQLEWLGYLSTTSVYGNWGGQLVDEDTECKATSEKAKSRYQSERLWLELRRKYGIPVHIFRLGGIYGPKRSILNRVEANKLTESQKQRRTRKYTARCHVHDICQVLEASMKAPQPGRVYNVVDDNPASSSVVEAFARSLLTGGFPDLATSMEELGCVCREGKRVSNRRIKEELGVSLMYPSYESGLLSIYENETEPFV